MTHPNGLSLVIPPKPLVAEQTGEGFRIRPENWRSMRTPADLIVELRTTQPAGDWPSSKTLGGTTVYFRIDSREGGSGGTERTLQAWKQVGSSWVWLSQFVQSESPADSDFTDGWTLLEQASVNRP